MFFQFSSSRSSRWIQVSFFLSFLFVVLLTIYCLKNLGGTNLWKWCLHLMDHVIPVSFLLVAILNQTDPLHLCSLAPFVALFYINVPVLQVLELVLGIFIAFFIVIPLMYGNWEAVSVSSILVEIGRCFIFSLLFFLLADITILPQKTMCQDTKCVRAMLFSLMK